MASTLIQSVGPRTSLPATGLSTLASATYVASSSYVPNTNKPSDVVIEVALATTNTPAGNRQALVFLQESLDGTNFRSGPISGTNTADEPDLLLLGTVPMNTSGITHRATFNIVQALGYVPHTLRVVIRNDLGVALTSGVLFTSELFVGTTP